MSTSIVASVIVSVVATGFLYHRFAFMQVFFFSSRRRHTRCALVTGVQTCALPIFGNLADPDHRARGPQRGRPRDPLWRPDDRIDGTRNRRDRPAAGEAGRL